MARTLRARLPRLFRTPSWVSWKKIHNCRFGIIEGDFLFYIWNGILCVLIRIASMRRFYWDHTTNLHVKENRKKKIPIMPPDLALWWTLISSNYLYLEHIFHGSKGPGTWLISQGSWARYPVWQHTFVSPSAFSWRAVVIYWRKYVHEVLVNRLGGLSLPRKSVVRLTDRPDMTLDVYRGRKTTKQQQQQHGSKGVRAIEVLLYITFLNSICDEVFFHTSVHRKRNTWNTGWEIVSQADSLSSETYVFWSQT